AGGAVGRQAHRLEGVEGVLAPGVDRGADGLYRGGPGVEGLAGGELAEGRDERRPQGGRGQAGADEVPVTGDPADAQVRQRVTLADAADGESACARRAE